MAHTQKLRDEKRLEAEAKKAKSFSQKVGWCGVDV